MGIRTPDLLIANETLYQLSYTPNSLDFNKLHDNLSAQDEACLYRYKGVEASVEAPRGAAPTNFCKVLRMSLVWNVMK